MKTTTICAKAVGLIGVIILLSCTSENPPQLHPKTSTTPIAVQAPHIIIDTPESGTVGLSVTFRWRIQDAREGETYQYKVRLDKGQNACDSGIEEEFDAERKTCLSVDLPSSRYSNASVDFAVLATDSQGHRFCAQGRRIVVDPLHRQSTSCDGDGDKKKGESNY
ncbi:MAG TPA: hypothetical protein VJ810_39540 [Blastocatellia bacterium]|nr:hypothetical protein [Blastocatellia bacterium]